ncbi:MAG: formate dehydrogenase N subunit beta transmembrane domain-containing protein, partial [Comamonas sp.]
PGLAHGLPKDPRISGVVESWKGWFKPLAAVGFATALLGAAAHYMATGPNEVDEDDDQSAGDKP